MTDCGKPHPTIAHIVCTKPSGHEGKHGRPDFIYRPVLWDLRHRQQEETSCPST